ncbi:hypothetical protein B0H13DRAFT_2269489 [Mycena leptocephala]|nr:hypothetical protein B0H13DRAFT_2269489 [Mycena leptocephala]
MAKTQEKLSTLTQDKKAAAACLKDLKSQKKTLGRVPRHSGSNKAGSASLIPKLVGNSAHPEDDTDKSDSEGELADSSSQFSQAIPSSPISSPLPILSAVDSESDFLPVKTPSLASFSDGNPSPVPEYTQPPTPQTSAEFDSNLFMVDPTAQFPAYSSFTDDELMKLLDGCSGFELGWLTIGTALDLNTPLVGDAGMAASALDTTLHENWSTLPPCPHPHRHSLHRIQRLRCLQPPANVRGTKWTCRITTSPLDPNTSLPAPLAARTRPARAPPLARYATLRPGRETPRISWRYWLGCVPPSFRFLSFAFPVIISSASVLREVWRRDCAVIAACVLFASADSSGRGWQRGALRARVGCGDAETLRKDAGRTCRDKRGSEFDEGQREAEEWNVSAMHRKPAMSLGRCGRILTLGGGNDGEREGDDARLRAARVWIMLGVTDGGAVRRIIRVDNLFNTKCLAAAAKGTAALPSACNRCAAQFGVTDSRARAQAAAVAIN